ncbi:cell wall-binding repeat-containing protein [Kineococcus sp. R86509]|uniref:cell wall-binding repeat-containing protein n=1 Tax=Kineococcus sp. R86509 TaxID=3093851 RepID=UPI0036D2C335
MSGSERRVRVGARRLLTAGVLAGVGIGLVTTGAQAATPLPDTPVVAHRTAGSDRYVTTAQMEVESRDTAYVVTGEKWADAVTAAAVGGRSGSNIFLTPHDQLPESVRAVIGLYRNVVVVGGEGSVGTGVWTWLQQNTRASISRVAGVDRYETAAKLSAASFAPGVANVLIATGSDYADALAGSSAAESVDSPVLLVQSGEIPASVAAELTRLQPRSVTVLGGTSSVSDAVLTQLRGYTTGAVTRLAGADRYGTAVAVSRTFFANGGRYPQLASGTAWPDAIAAGAFAAHNASPVLLTPRNCVPQDVNVEIERLSARALQAVGGTPSLADTAIDRTDCDAVPSTYLSDLAGPTGNAAYVTAHAFLGGHFYPRSIAYVTDPRNSEYRVWTLGGTYQRFTATVGVSDAATSGLTSHVEVFGDDRLLGAYDVGAGKPATVDVAVRGVQNLKVVTTSSARSATDSDARANSVYLGDAGLN